MIYDMESILPHSGNMIFVDEILECKNDSIIVKSIIKEDNPFLQDGYLPSFCFIEIMAQSIATLSGYTLRSIGHKAKIGLLLGGRKLKFLKDKVKAKSVLKSVVIGSLQDENGFGVFDCSLFLDEELIASGKLNVFSPNDEYLKEIMK